MSDAEFVDKSVWRKRRFSSGKSVARTDSDTLEICALNWSIYCACFNNKFVSNKNRIPLFWFVFVLLRNPAVLLHWNWRIHLSRLSFSVRFVQYIYSLFRIVERRTNINVQHRDIFSGVLFLWLDTGVSCFYSFARHVCFKRKFILGSQNLPARHIFPRRFRCICTFFGQGPRSPGRLGYEGREMKKTDLPPIRRLIRTDDIARGRVAVSFSRYHARLRAAVQGRVANGDGRKRVIISRIGGGRQPSSDARHANVSGHIAITITHDIYIVLSSRRRTLRARARARAHGL